MNLKLNLCTGVLIFGSIVASQASSIAISFNRNDDEIFATTETAGATNVAQKNWNQSDKGASGTMALNDDSGATSGANIAWTSAGTYAQGTPGDANKSIIKGYLDDGSTGWTVTVSNLSYTLYDVYLYAAGDVAQSTLLGGYTVGGVTGDFLRGANLPASGGILTEGSTGVEGRTTARLPLYLTYPLSMMTPTSSIG